MAQYVACPRCETENPEKVGFTWWGGVIGPKILSHVRCRKCRWEYNGKSGKSNTGGIVIYTVVIIAIIAVIAIAVMAK